MAKRGFYVSGSFAQQVTESASHPKPKPRPVLRFGFGFGLVWPSTRFSPLLGDDLEPEICFGLWLSFFSVAEKKGTPVLDTSFLRGGGGVYRNISRGQRHRSFGFALLEPCESGLVFIERVWSFQGPMWNLTFLFFVSRNLFAEKETQNFRPLLVSILSPFFFGHLI